jgi:hypothetical protein
MKRLHQGHLNLKLEVLRLNRTGVSRVGGEHSRKEPFEQLVNSNSEHVIYERATTENAPDNIKGLMAVCHSFCVFTFLSYDTYFHTIIYS